MRIIALTLAALLVAAPVTAQDREVRTFEEFGLGFLDRSEGITEAVGASDWSTASTLLEELTVWVLEADPDPCYAVMWGLAAAWSASATQLAILTASGSSDVVALMAMNDFQSRITDLQQQALAEMGTVCL